MICPRLLIPSVYSKHSDILKLLFIGLKLEIMHQIINNMGSDIKNGTRYSSGNFYDDILEGYKCWMTEVPKEDYKYLVGFGLWYYKGGGFPLLQCVWPAKKGGFPWEESYPGDLKKRQPLLGKAPLKC